MTPGSPAHVAAVALLVAVFLATGWLIMPPPLPVYPDHAERRAELLR